MKIGSLTIRHPYVLAPMAGVTDLPFRLLCKEQGAGLLCMEMVSAKALQYKNRNTEALLAIHPAGVPGLPPALRLRTGGDQRAGQSHRGAALSDPGYQHGLPGAQGGEERGGIRPHEKPAPCLRDRLRTVKAIQKPVTVKIRKGFDDTCVNAVEIARIIEEAGAAAVAVHGRTREQYYAGKADWDIIRQVKQAVGIPVIGNGDVTCVEDARRMMDETGCDGVMIARGARGNPWIFRELKAYDETGQIPPRPSVPEIREMMLRHARLQVEYKGSTPASGR